jgi:hypothetical protein
MATYYEDYDDDGYGDPLFSLEDCGAPAGYVSNDDDCNDIDGSIHPGAVDTAWDGIDQDCDGADERDTDCIADGVDGAMLDVMDGAWPVEDHVEDGILYDLTLTNQELLFDVLGTAITVVEEGRYYATIPVDVSVNSEEDPFDIEVEGLSIIPDTVCVGWIEPTDLDVEATIDVSVDEDGLLIVDVAEFYGVWYGVGEADMELDGCYYDSLDTFYAMFGGDLTDFYDDLLLAEITALLEASEALIDVFVELECTP